MARCKRWQEEVRITKAEGAGGQVSIKGGGMEQPSVEPPTLLQLSE
jgi:hypothetical protein